MASIQIQQYNASRNESDESSQASKDVKLRRSLELLYESKDRQNFTFGVPIQDKNIIQFTSSTPLSEDVKKQLVEIYGTPQSSFEVRLNRDAFNTNGPATANVVEYVQNFFPSSRATPEFRKQIEEDFLRFDKIYQDCAAGSTDFAFGWVEDQEHEDIEGEKAAVFLIARGWQDMASFEQSIKQPAYAEAIPILFAWKAPFKMWHVERKSLESLQS